MTVSHRAKRVTLRMGTEADRDTLYRLRHAIYGQELRQHALNEEQRLRDSLDAFNTYFVACIGPEIIGFISVTPPCHESYSIDKYVDRTQLPFAVDDHLFELRLLTVLPEHRHSPAAFLLMYAATVWVWSQGGTRIVAIGRHEVRDLYLRVGMQSHGLEIRSGAVSFDLMSVEVATLHKGWQRYGRILRKLEATVDWHLELPFQPPEACFHGGASFEAIGDSFDSLERRARVINADVLDAWFPPAPGVIAALGESLEWLARTSPPTHSEGLIRTIAAVRGVPEASILPGAGSSSLMYLVLREWLTRESRALVLDPSYGEYTHLFEKVIGCSVDRFSLDPDTDYLPDLVKLEEQLQKSYDLVVLVNPNSPTGRYVPGEEIEALLRRAPSRTRFWIDETYLEYVGADRSLERFAARSSNAVVCKSMSKVYALSGLRAAYLCGPPARIQPLLAIAPPWSVGLPAQVAAVRALQDPEYYAARYRETHVLREELRTSLLSLGMPTVVQGVANFLLMHLPLGGPDSETVLARCHEHDLFLRNPGTTSPRLGTCTARIAVKDARTNAEMIEILRKALVA